MSINDVQNELDDIKKNVNNNDKCKNEQSDIKYILKKNISNLESFVDGKVVNMYARPWNKLEPKLKRTKIYDYLHEELNKNEINLLTFNNLIYKLHKEIEFNRKLKIKYDHETCVINEFDYKDYL